jgi:thiamine biosynthesis lipoprotein
MSFNLSAISALGTSWWIEICDAVDEKRRVVIYDDCAAFLQTFEKAYSRFDPASQINQLNTTHVVESPTKELQELLTFGIAQFTRTAGIFNIMVGSKLVETGYDAAYSFTAKSEHTPIQNPHDVLSISEERITLKAGLVDIGGFGKGWAIDAIATLLKEKHELQYFLVNGGGDMYATSDHDTPFTIYLEHPTETDTYLTTTTIKNQGFAASSPHKRAWTHGGKTYTHIIDTKIDTNQPHTTRPDATFLKAATACDADIFATVALLVDADTMTQLATRENLGVASFFRADSSFSHNEAFI